LATNLDPIARRLHFFGYIARLFDYIDCRVDCIARGVDYIARRIDNITHRIDNIDLFFGTWSKTLPDSCS
jgi:hypothetical protein